MNTPKPGEILELWQESWPERLPHPAGLAQRLTEPSELIFRRDQQGQLIAVAAWRGPEHHPYGYLRLLLVHPAWQRRGIGRALVAEARERLGGVRLGGVRLALGEERGHFLPGATPESLPFWLNVGFVPTGATCVDMRRDLRGPLPAPALSPALRVTDAREAGVLGGVLALTREVFSPRWTADALHTARSPEQVLALLSGPQVIGFALTGLQTDPVILPSFLYPQALRQGLSEVGVVGGLGPIGLHPDHRGSGLGRAFMLAAMHHLKGRGAQVMGIDWTSIAPFYQKLGFQSWTTYHHMRG